MSRIDKVVVIEVGGESGRVRKKWERGPREDGAGQSYLTLRCRARANVDKLPVTS